MAMLALFRKQIESSHSPTWLDPDTEIHTHEFTSRPCDWEYIELIVYGHETGGEEHDV